MMPPVTADPKVLQQDPHTAWETAAWAAAAFAADPVGLQVLRVRAPAGPVRDHWLDLLRHSLPQDTPWHKCPAGIADDRLIGGLDLTASLSLGRPVEQRGLLVQAHRGVVVFPMAERLSAATAARLAQVLDRGVLEFEREGLSHRWDCQVGMVLLDEGESDQEHPPASLLHRTAIQVDLRHLGLHDVQVGSDPPATPLLAPGKPAGTASLSDAAREAVVATACALGIDDLRLSVLALRLSRVIARLRDHAEVQPHDLQWAIQWCLAPHATRLPGAEPEEVPADAEVPSPSESPPQDLSSSPPAPPHVEDDRDHSATDSDSSQALQEQLIAAAAAMLPPDWLRALTSAGAASQAGRVGQLQACQRGGRSTGSRPGTPTGHRRLHVVDTLRAAAPWQRLRRMSASQSANRLKIHLSDLRVHRMQQRSATAMLFVIDASGSSALHRLGEAKGAVQLLLAECYARRDLVGVIAFRGTSAQVLLPPTRSLVRARRSLAALPGGGGTPLALGIEAAWQMAAQVRRLGASPLVVMLTDGRANIDRSGQPGRAQAQSDALRAARQLRLDRVTTLLIDTSPQAAAAGSELAVAMGAHYRALPYAAAHQLRHTVQSLAQELSA